MIIDDFLIRALLAGLGVSIAAAPLGAFVVWRRMAYFGGALSHTALLGVALGFLAGVHPAFGVAVVTAVAALLLSGFKSRHLGTDTMLGIIAHGALAAGLIAISMLEGVRVDLFAFLFGDILSVGATDVAMIWIGAITVLAALIYFWRPLLAVTVHSELAHVEGVNVRRVETIFVLLLALVVALAIQVVGVLLVASMLIVPAAAARELSKTPEQMAVLAAVAGWLAVGAGLAASMWFDWPAGPAIVASSVVLYMCTRLVPARS